MTMRHRIMVNPEDFGSADLGSIPSAVVKPTLMHHRVVFFAFVKRS